MIEIKFRAWDKERKIMICSECVDLNIKGEAFHIPKITAPDWDVPVPNFTFSVGEDTIFPPDIRILSDDRFVKIQYTGLKDKNGVEIYEGDIISNSNNNIGVVTWEDNSDDCECGMVGFGLPFWGDYSKKFEVIGNIYENPELMEDDGDYKGGNDVN